MNILLTRALGQVKPLELLVLERGYRTILFPTLKVVALHNSPTKIHYDALIFISVNAVECGLKALNSLSHQHRKIFAVGAITAKKLNDYGFKVDAFPQQNASSESLLAMDEVSQLSYKNILIFRGKGGRETLKEGLEKKTKNNTVEYIEVYERTQCKILPIHQKALTQFLQNDKGIITITSIENLSNMMDMIEQINADAIELIKCYPLVVLSKRIKTYALSIGFSHIKVASQINDEGLVQALDTIL